MMRWDQFMDFIAAIEDAMDKRGLVTHAEIKALSLEAGIHPTVFSSFMMYLSKMGVLTRCKDGQRVHYKKRD
jgi:hypothetical protein